jgi:hypothetical protein
MGVDPRSSRERGSITITRTQQRFVSWTTDVLVYIVVLNLFVEFADSVVIDSFTISIFTAVVLKAMLDLILGFEHRVGAWFAEREGPASKALSVTSTLAILFLSKFVILEVIDIVFGDDVELGGLVEVVLLVIALMVANRAFLWFYEQLGDGAKRTRPG